MWIKKKTRYHLAQKYMQENVFVGSAGIQTRFVVILRVLHYSTSFDR